MSGPPSLSLALHWLMRDQSRSAHELALQAGVSPAATLAFLQRPSAPTLTWLGLLAALGCRVEIRAPGRFMVVAMPRLAGRRLERERDAWAARRLTAFRSQLRRQGPERSPADIEATAAAYVAASAARTDDELAAARHRLDHTRIDTAVCGLRAAVACITSAAGIPAEDLALLSGMSLGAAQSVLGNDDDGRLATPHRLFSALAARLVILPAGGGAVTIAMAAPGSWRPEAPRSGRTSLGPDAIRRRALGGESLASIARTAGVSRQRIHAIVHTEG